MAAVHSFKSSRGKDRVINAVARALRFFAVVRSIEFRFLHVPGISMHRADVLSRAFIDHDAHLRASDLIRHENLTLIHVTPSMHDFNNFF